MLKSNDPKAQIIYQEMEHGNYMMFFYFNTLEEESKPSNDQGIWMLGFDVICASTGSRVGVVLISLDGDLTQLAYSRI